MHGINGGFMEYEWDIPSSNVVCWTIHHLWWIFPFIRDCPHSNVTNEQNG